MNLESTFEHALRPYKSHNYRLVLGLSGGLDSRVMLQLIANYQALHHVECLAVHVHHGLSPFADEWAERCEGWCKELGVAFRLEKVSLDLEGRSLEESAREARYQALKKHLSHQDVLLVGQHADDQLETFLLALKRGSGPKGLSSMAQVMSFGSSLLIRPLLSATRADIESFAQAHQLDWVEDESNQDQRFERNFVRHSITPVMTERWPHIRQSIQRSAELCAEQEQLLDELMQEKLVHTLHADGSLIIDVLEQSSALARMRLLRMWIEQAGCKMPSRVQLTKIWQEVAMSQQDANPQLTLSEVQIRRFSNRLYLVQEWQSLEQWKAPIHFDERVSLPDGLGTLTLATKQIEGLSKAALSQAPLWISFNPEGLSAHPADRTRSRKLKKLFQEYGVPSWLRRRTPILMCGEQVVAVANLFIDRRFIGQDCELTWDKPTSFV